MTQLQGLQQDLQQRRQAFRKIRARLRIAADALENVGFKAAQATTQLQELSRSLVQAAEKIQETRRRLNQERATSGRAGRSGNTSKSKRVVRPVDPLMRTFPGRRGT